MRLWLRDSERLPDPAPVKTDDRTPIVAGIIAWSAALAVVPVLLATGVVDDPIWMLTCGVGIVLGMLGLIYVRSRRHL